MFELLRVQKRTRRKDSAESTFAAQTDGLLQTIMYFVRVRQQQQHYVYRRPLRHRHHCNTARQISLLLYHRFKVDIQHTIMFKSYFSIMYVKDLNATSCRVGAFVGLLHGFNARNQA